MLRERRHRINSEAETCPASKRGSSGIVAVRHLTYRMAAPIEGGTHQGATGVEVGADARGLPSARLTRRREEGHHRLIGVLTSIVR
jgi:hypothetical protein